MEVSRNTAPDAVPTVVEDDVNASVVPPAACVPNKTLCDWNFDVVEVLSDGKKIYKCRRCSQTNIKGNVYGYKNLLSHMVNESCFGIKLYNAKDPNFNEGMQPAWRAYWASRAIVRNDRPTIQDKSLPRRVFNIYNWIRLVVHCDNPLSICENLVYRDVVKMDKMSRKTLRKYIIMLADVVGIKIRESIQPGNCIADGWSCAGVHYYAILHRWPVLQQSYGESKIVVKTALLSCSPFINERSLDAKTTVESIESVYAMYGSPTETELGNGSAAKRLIVCFTLDNTNVNPCVAKKIGKPMIGAYCHRLNLAARGWCKQAFGGCLNDDLATINAVMIRASTLKARGALKEFTPYIPERNNKTRWTGFQDMAVKYSKIHSALQKTNMYNNLQESDAEEVDGTQVVPRLFSGTRLRRFNDQFLPALKKLRQWFKAIQNENIDLAQARAYFEAARTSPSLRKQSQEFEDRLKPDHALVVAPDFENGVEKILKNCSEEMTSEEQKACGILAKDKWLWLYPPRDEEEDDDDSDIEIANVDSPSKISAKWRRKNSKSASKRQKTSSKYIDNLSWIHPTTVPVERIFSLCGNIMNEDRRKMSPHIFEALVCLKVNQEWWNADTIKDMKDGKYDDGLKALYRDYDKEAESDEEHVEVEDN